MKVVYLVLTSPYDYDQALARAVAEAQESGAKLRVVFLIDPDAITTTVHDMGESGWLGLGSQQRLRESILQGYRSLAEDVLRDIQAKSIPNLETSALESNGHLFLQEKLQEDGAYLIVCGDDSLKTRLMPYLKQIEFIEIRP